ncbi:PAS domain S-box protein [Herminiimonas fonticola]|uniref:histidine kinase n=1 Tax=Herminiimonas fonticola TaxID=303380 RepID=A0A4R6G8D7_9BURK|nr:PAS domain S-box protein [Herminiimonas fonticola]RBA24066.1 PAS domain S-box protein [Herminiimonas fonticola]TDN90065.1 PAS domain S-box-containing protein [Herminiimonas fonticola]
MKKSVLTLRRSIVLAVAIGLLVPAIAINGYSWFKTYDTEVNKSTIKLAEENALALADTMSEAVWNLKYDDASALADAAMWRNDDIVRIEIRDNKRTVFVSDQRRKRPSGFIASSETNIYYRGQVAGSLKIEVGGARLQKMTTNNLLQQLWPLAFQIAVSILLILLFFERRLIRPLLRLNTDTQQLLSGQLDHTIGGKRHGEIALLSQQLETIRKRLREIFGDTKQENISGIDQHQQTRIQLALQERETRFRVFLEQSPIAIIEWDKKLQVVEWNPAAERIFGYRRDLALGRHIRFLAPLDKRHLIEDIVLQSRSNPADTQSIQENLTADGRIITCEWHYSTIDDDAGNAGRLLSMVEDITEKRRVAEVQRLSEAKFAGAFRCNPEPISIARYPDGTFIEVNAAFEKILGFTRDEWLLKNGLRLHIWVYPEERTELFQLLERDKQVENFAWSMRNKAGEIHHCLLNATLFCIDDETYMLAVMRDVTSQRLLEEQKMEADHALLRLAQGTQGIAGEPFFELLVNDLAAALRTDCALIALRSSTDPQRILTLASHMHGEIVDNFECAIPGTPYGHTLDAGLCVFTHDVQNMFAQNASLIKRGWDSYAGAPLHDANGLAIGVLAVMHSKPLRNPDLVKSLLQVFSERASAELERKRAEEELRLSEQRFATIFHSTPVPMFVTQLSNNNVIKDVNAAFEQLFKRTRQSVLGKNTLDLAMYCNPADRDAVLSNLQSTGSLEQLAELWMYCGDQSKILIQFSGHVFLLEGEQFGILACQDITEKRLIETEILEFNATLEDRVVERTEELQQANQELETTLEALNMAHEELVNNEKLAALGALVAGISHELNTPIGNSLMVASTLSNQTSKLLDNYRGDKGIKRSSLESYFTDVDKASDILVRNLHRAADLVNSFKQVAIDQTSSQRRSFSLEEITGEILLTLWPAIRKTPFTVEQSIPADLTFDSYPGPLGQVLTNLISNALLHGFEGRTQGSVVVGACNSADGWVEITVKDDGIGIPGSNLTRIFDPFFTTKLGEGGSGLGLNITHNIVSGILGGRVRVQSAVGTGTTFTLTLPLVAPQHSNDNDTLHPLA